MSDLDIIKKIEKELKVKLKKLGKIYADSKGYILNKRSQVTGLSLCNCGILNLNRITTQLKSLENLTELNLRLNFFTDISTLKTFKNLTFLNLGGNSIHDISPLKNLNKLSRLVLYVNQIEELPRWIIDFNMEINMAGNEADGYIDLYSNPLKTPPPEIVKQGKEAVRNYFEQLKAQEEDYLFEAKMLIVGEPGAGKTSMAWKMENASCELPMEEETTKGIDVKQFYFPLRKEDFSEI